VEEPSLTSICIVDRNGFTETISSPDRIEQFENVDFLVNQPYKKVTRVYERDGFGDIKSYITSYHPNGQAMQYLEVTNGRAYGVYKEWHSNGILKMDAFVVGGNADLTPGTENTWLFDGTNRVWDEDNNLIAEITYSKGQLQGLSTQFHPNGSVWKQTPYDKNVIQGTSTVYLNNGDVFSTTNYVNGLKDGQSIRYWCEGKVASDENYCAGRLKDAVYYDSNGNIVAKVENGTGMKAVFGKTTLSELHEHHNGLPQGEVKIFNPLGRLVKTYNVRNGIKHGTEIEYYDQSMTSKLTPKLSVEWYQGKIQGLVKTWYINGTMESQREMSGNNKQGLSSAWYVDGTLMLMEEYDNGKLDRGDYFKRADRVPVSQIRKGNGVATLFDSEGHYINKANYANGKPVLSPQ
jgi:antitoxin component YwqK of YwqJK toxin-antitoxin module